MPCREIVCNFVRLCTWSFCLLWAVIIMNMEQIGQRTMDAEVSSSFRQRPFRVAVEGNIGSGKSTFLDYCRRHSDVEVVPEPVSDWINVDGINLMGKFYENPLQHAMPFQSYVSLTTIENHLRESQKLLKITERSIYSSRYCFVESLMENGHLDRGAYSVLVKWFGFAEKHFDMRPDAIVYIHTTPSVAHERMVRRARAEEVVVGLNYLEQLDRLHGDWIAQESADMMDDASRTTVFTLDGDRPLGELESAYERCLGDLRLLTL